MSIQLRKSNPLYPYIPFAPETNFARRRMLEKVYKLEKGSKGIKGWTALPPATPIHDHQWEKQPDLCLYERRKAAFWVTLMCTTCGLLDGYHLPRKSVPEVLRVEALVVREF